MNTLNGMNPAVHPDRSHRMLIVAIGVAAGFLGANAFADAVGFPAVTNAERESGYLMLRIFAGGLVALLTMVFAGFAVREARALARLLAGSERRPTPAIAMALIVCGTVCLLGALAVPLYAAHAGAMTGVRVTQTPAGIHTSLELPMITNLLAVLTFLAGAVLVGLGVWGGAGGTTSLTPREMMSRPAAVSS